jgi:hypothetical protein
LESYQHEKWATGKEAETDQRCYKQSPQNRRNGSMSVGYKVYHNVPGL